MLRGPTDSLACQPLDQHLLADFSSPNQLPDQPWHPRPHHSLLSYALVILTVVPVQLKVSHTAGKTLFLSESGRVLLEEVSVSIRGLRTGGETVVSDTD